MKKVHMNCERVQLLLNAYLDGELDLVTSLDIEEHLRGCDICMSQYRSLVNLQATIRDSSVVHSAPANLEKRIKASLNKIDAPVQAESIFRRSWFAPTAVLVALLFIFVVVISRGLFITNQEALVAQEVQIAHVRSLMADHLMDVASSDQHTVKPWFNGKLDFSPPVTDLTVQGFPLVGGRLDYLAGQSVAALVYQRNKHYINVFIWPSQSQVMSVQSSTDHGYHLFHWDQSGMAFWAISDLNSDELLGFIDVFRKSLP
jgi:anti-sigma factor RsiW